MTSTTERLSPMMIQWHTCKKNAENAILLFRLGDFYEAFYEDAQTLSRELGLTLTQRQNVAMAGIPFHASEQYIDKLIAKGFKVAIAEQMEDPKETKGLVKREIVRMITPGTVIHSSLLQDKSNNFICCLAATDRTLGLSILDLTTAECKVTQFESLALCCDELIRIKPKELLVSQQVLLEHKKALEEFLPELRCLLQPRADSFFHPQYTIPFLQNHFSITSLYTLGLQDMPAAANAAAALLSYVEQELKLSIDHIKEIKQESSCQYMSLDSATLRHLEILENMHDKESKYSLLHHIDKTVTPMGGRLIKHWISHPLLSLQEIEARQDAVAYLMQSANLHPLIRSLSKVKDLERLIMRIETGFGGPKDLQALRLSLEAVPEISTYLQDPPPALLKKQLSQLRDLSSITQKLQSALTDDPPLRVSDGNVIRRGFNAELDALRDLCTHSQDWIASYQAQLRLQTELKTLKIGYTKAFGYYIEVSRLQAEKIPASFQRRQTLVNTERFTTQDLQNYEHKILSAEEKIGGIEQSLFFELRHDICSYSSSIRKIAAALAHIDCLCSFAKYALTHSCIRPTLDDKTTLNILEGRHPVIEACLKSDPFIPNDVYLNDQDQRLFVITGPNMAGKSTFIRQVALLVILAQIGSFIPAKSAHIGLIDKVFTRIGASDNLSRGQSTFMVEMAETANILRNATDRSLVILDEIGRGTSTYDGISIAWAVAEYLLTTPHKKAKTLFATHYCELLALEHTIPGAVNYHVAVHESDKGIVFLHKIVRGGTGKSYGIHVAKLAGLPAPVLDKARQLLHSLEQGSFPKHIPLQQPPEPPEHPMINRLRTLDINSLTPLQALQRLSEWKAAL